MRSHKQLLTALLVTGLLAVCAAPFAMAATTADAKQADASLSNAVTKLTKGMSASEVEQLLGKPLEVKVMKSPSGKAEVWSYSHQISINTRQIQVGSKPITVMVRGTDGTERPTVISEEPIYKNQNEITEETLALLMFNDHFLEKKLGTQVRKEFL